MPIYILHAPQSLAEFDALEESGKRRGALAGATVRDRVLRCTNTAQRTDAAPTALPVEAGGQEACFLLSSAGVPPQVWAP